MDGALMGNVKPRKQALRTKIWCPLRTCVHNVNMRCIAPAIKLHLASNGKLLCHTYKKRSGWPPALDYFKKEIQEGWIEDQADDKQEELDISPDIPPEMRSKASEGSKDTSTVSDDESA